MWCEMYACICAVGGGGQVDIKYPPLLLSTLFFKTGSLIEPEAWQPG